MSRKVLIIDDDAELASFLARFLEKYGFELIHAANPEDGMRALERDKPDAVLLDITLPGISGLQLCREIRVKNPVPIIMISALGETSDRVVGLELGADDYLPKPFEPRELVARLEALLRLVKRVAVPPSETVITLGELEVDRSRRSATLRGEALEFTSAEFELLLVFVARPGHVFNRDELLNELRGIDWDAYNRSVDILVSRLRRKLKDNAKSPRFLKTVWGAGYTFLPQEAKRQAG